MHPIGRIGRKFECLQDSGSEFVVSWQGEDAGGPELRLAHNEDLTHVDIEQEVVARERGRESRDIVVLLDESGV